MRRDDPQNRGAGEHHREREQRGERALTERHGPPDAHSYRGPFKAPQPAVPRFTFLLRVRLSVARVLHEGTTSVLAAASAESKTRGGVPVRFQSENLASLQESPICFIRPTRS